MATESITKPSIPQGEIIPPRYRLTESEMVAQCREAERRLRDAAEQYPEFAEIYRDAIKRLWVRMDKARKAA